MLTLFYTERVSKAYRMLQIRQQSDHITPEMEKLKEDIELFRKAADYYDFTVWRKHSRLLRIF